MTTRTFKQLGQAYGTTPVTITATIDGAQIFSGTVGTLNAAPGGDATDNVLFSWERDVTFSGVQNLTIHVEGGSSVRLEKIIANHILVPYPNQAPASVPGGDRQFGTCWFEVVDGLTTVDPKKNVKINGILQPRFLSEETTGQWLYLVPSGSTLTAEVHTRAGVDLPAWSTANTYAEQTVVIHNDILYFAKQAVPANQDINTTSYWASLPLPEWQADRSYGAMATVQHQNRIYTSRFAVPQGTDIVNPNYWNDYAGDAAEHRALGYQT